MGYMKYTQTVFWNAMALPRLNESIIMNAFAWYDKTQTAGDGSIGPCSSMLFELFCVTDAPDRSASGWPRPVGFKHMVLLGSGAPTIGPMHDLAKQLVIDGSKEVIGADAKLDVTPNALEDFHDPKDVSGDAVLST